MKKFIETIKNIFKIEELRTRLGYTFLLVLIYRLGCFIVLPGIDTTLLASLQDSTQQGLVGLLNMFSGGAFSFWACSSLTSGNSRWRAKAAVGR